MRSRLATCPIDHQGLTLSLVNVGTQEPQRGTFTGDMDGGESVTHDASHDALPFRLNDVNVEPKFFDFHPLIPQIRQELMFQLKLIRTDWNPQFTIQFCQQCLQLFSAHSMQISLMEGMQRLQVWKVSNRWEYGLLSDGHSPYSFGDGSCSCSSKCSQLCEHIQSHC